MSNIDLWNYISKADGVQDSERLFSLFKDTLGSLGIDQVVYSLLTEHHSIDKKAKHAMFSGYRDDWMNFYVEKNYENLDPVIKYMMVKNGFFLWKNLEQEFRTLSQKERNLMHEARDAGLRNGAGISIFNGRSEICGMGFANSNGDLDWRNPGLQSAVYMIASHFHMTYFGVNEASREEK